jgi:L-iditol 2-dehydrogenase
MFAAKLIAPKTFKLIEMPAPDITTAPPDSVIVKTYRATTCGSDMPYFLGVFPESMHMAPQAFPAHECVGVITASNSDRFKVGDTVMGQPDAFTGLGEYYMARAKNTTHIPSDGDWNKWVMCQPLGTVIWGFRHINTLYHQNVVVIGQGGMGLFCTQMAACVGARNIIVVDVIKHRLEIAKSVGATHAIEYTNDDELERTVHDIVGPEGVDMVFEVVGHQTNTINTAIRLVKYGGSILAVGVPDVDIYPMNYGLLFRKNVRFITTVSPPDYPKDFSLAVEYIRRGLVNVKPFVTHEFPFAQAATAYDIFATRRDNVIKVMLNYEHKP